MIFSPRARARSDPMVENGFQNNEPVTGSNGEETFRISLGSTKDLLHLSLKLSDTPQPRGVHDPVIRREGNKERQTLPDERQNGLKLRDPRS